MLGGTFSSFLCEFFLCLVFFFFSEPVTLLYVYSALQGLQNFCCMLNTDAARKEHSVESR